MVCLAQNNPISLEARELIATRPYYHEGLRKLAALLPESDRELEQWFSATVAALDEESFIMLISAAAMGGRKLPASLLLPAMMFRLSPWNLAWIAWRMEGNVTEELLRASEKVETVSDEGRALVLFVAAAWWLEHRKEEEVPHRILRLASCLGKKVKKRDLKTQIILRDLAMLLGGAQFSVLCAREKVGQSPAQQRRDLAKIFGLLEGPFEKFIHERETHEYSGTLPLRRAVEEIGRNKKCRCGSGRKYKRCCEKADQQRLRRSSPVAGVTRDELKMKLNIPLTTTSLAALGPSGIARIDPADVPEESQALHVTTLLALKFYEPMIAAFRVYGVPESLEGAWGMAFEAVSESWLPDIARALMEVFPEADEKLGVKAHAAVRLLLVGDDPAALMEELRSSVEVLLKSGDLEELQKLTWTMLESPYRGLGILLARSVLPLVEEKYVEGLFDGILEARSRLNLPPEDAFSDWIDEQALRRAWQHETAESQQAQDKFEAVLEERRVMREREAQLERELALMGRRLQRESEEAKEIPPPDAEVQRIIREKNAELKQAQALVTEKSKEVMLSRRAIAKAMKEKEALEAVVAEMTQTAEVGDDEQDFQVPGNPPVRVIAFPRGFEAKLAALPRHVGRATMIRLGRLAAGEPSAFAKIKPIKALPGVLRARVSDKYRLFFIPESTRIRVVEIIRRADLERAIESLKAGGLPAVA